MNQNQNTTGLEGASSAAGWVPESVIFHPASYASYIPGELVELEAELAQPSPRLEHVFRMVASTPWAVTPEVLAVITDLISYRMAGHKLTGDEVADRIAGDSPMAARRPRQPARRGAVAVLSLYGVIAPRAAMVDNVSGPSGTGLDAFAANLQDAVDDPDVASIVIDVNSPGGTVDMVPETAARIRDARDTKPVRAVANTDAGSAAYWLASQASEVWVTPSGQVGSIGVYAAHQDLSVKYEMEGKRVSLISAGKFKVEGNPFQALSEEARDAIQSVVNEFYDWFVADVAAGRRTTEATVRAGFGEGRMLPAKRALGERMVDGVDTLENVIGRALRGEPTRGRAMSSSSSVSVTTDNITTPPPTDEQADEAASQAGVPIDHYVSL